MQILPMSDLTMTPTLGALLGTSVNGSVLEGINQQYGNGVLFGNEDPFASRFSALKNIVQNQLLVAGAQVEQIRAEIASPYQYREIQSEDDLRNIPLVMQLPMLMTPKVRELFDDARISGWNFEAGSLPEEDFYGRLIDNGTVTIDHSNSETNPEYFTYEFNSSDPDLELEDLSMIERSREWICKWLEEEMSEGGEWRDPTDLSNKISRVKRKRD